MKAKGLILICLFAVLMVPVKAQNRPDPDKDIHHDPEADFKQRRGLTHNRNYLAKKLAPFHLNIDSLQDVVDYLNRDTKAKEWEYQVSTVKGSEGQVLKFYKSHRNADGSSGRTIYGDERRRWPDR